MGVLKNGVGRPSNETIQKRNIFKVTTLVLSVGIIGLTAYILNDKGIINLNNKKTSDSNNDIVTTTIATEKEENQTDEIFDLSKVSIGQNCISDCTDTLSIYGKEVPIDGVVDFGKYYALNDLLVIEKNMASESGSSIAVYDKTATKKVEYKEFGYTLCPSGYGFDNDCYDFKVEDNKIKYTLVIDAQDASTICGDYNAKESFMEYEVEYKNGVLSNPKKIKSLTGKQLISNNNIKCN